MVLNVVARPGDCWASMRRLVFDNDEPRVRQLRHARRALAIYRGLLSTGVVERLAAPDAEGRLARVTVELQPEFALNQPLSPFALAAVDLLDPEAETYALDVVSVVESTLEDPTPVLRAQRSRARGEAVEAMKREGIEYEERVELVEDVTYPQPAGRPAGGGLRGVRAQPPVGAGRAAEPEVGGPRPGRAVDDLHRVRGVLRAGPGRGGRAALPGRRLQGPPADRAGGRARPSRWPT